MSSKELLEHQLQEIKVLNAELASLRPNATLYERQVPSSNVFFLARDHNAVKSAAKRNVASMETQLLDYGNTFLIRSRG
ncbi:hypothetical protein BX666DRAFT_1897117 [Dichotomocladium elegans]|nr:hypothetical protein BX666DRAFT_1897117 [Dichotomocladium elegans]